MISVLFVGVRAADCVAALKDRLDKLEADMKKELVKVFLSC